MNWIINGLLILFILHFLMRITQIFKCNSNGKNCDICSWLDVCYDYDEHSQLLSHVQWVEHQNNLYPGYKTSQMKSSIPKLKQEDPT